MTSAKIAQTPAAQRLEMVAWRYTKIGIRDGVIQHLQLPEQSALQFRRNPLGRDILDKEVAQLSRFHLAGQRMPTVIPSFVLIRGVGTWLANLR